MDSLPVEFVQVTMVDRNAFPNILKHNIVCLIVASYIDLLIYEVKINPIRPVLNH